jgi:hypothetical protein
MDSCPLLHALDHIETLHDYLHPGNDVMTLYAVNKDFQSLMRTRYPIVRPSLRKFVKRFIMSLNLRGHKPNS